MFEDSETSAAMWSHLHQGKQLTFLIQEHLVYFRCTIVQRNYKNCDLLLIFQPMTTQLCSWIAELCCHWWKDLNKVPICVASLYDRRRYNRMKLDGLGFCQSFRNWKSKYIFIILSGKQLTFSSNSLISEAEGAVSSPTHSLIFNQVPLGFESGSVLNSSMDLIQIELD